RKEFRLVVERPAEQDQVIQQGVWQVADFAVELDDDGIKRLGGCDVADLRRDSCPMLIHFLYITVLEILRDLSLADIVLAAGLGNERVVGVLRQRIAESLRDENLPRRV